MRQDEDLILVEKVKSGDKASFDKLYNKYKRVILNYLYRMLHNREMAEEITQETFIKVYVKIDKYKPTGTFSSWVYAIARNLAKNEIRRLSSKKNISLETSVNEDGSLTLNDVIKSDTFDVESTLRNKEIQSQIEGALGAMPIEHREVITLCAIQGLSYDEAAEVLNCTRSAVAVRLFRARKCFIKLMEEKNSR